jgi:single-stranded-DNA-specific exonuclease
MQPLNKNWDISPGLSPQAKHNLSEYPPVLQQLLYNRGYDTSSKASQFLNAAKPEKSNPYLLAGMSVAVDRIMDAIQSSQPITIYGDYDVDGVSATALLLDCLEELGASVDKYIPNRFDEGYGLNIEALDFLKNDGTKLVISVDCGIRSLIEANHAANIGLDMIISDHHQPLEELPTAVSILNPKAPDDRYPDKDLAGVGVAYKLAEALWQRKAESDLSIDTSRLSERLTKYHDLVALGTVADLAPLVGENRYLVASGLKEIKKSRRQGLLSLIRNAGKDPQKITSSDISFVLGPRLNAAGRLESALASLDLLRTTELEQAALLAQELSNWNRDRQILTRDLQKQAEALVFKDGAEPLLMFASSPEFNPGVIGLVASKLVEQYYRPAIIANQGEEFTRASCRSIPEFHITQALDQCVDLLERHGGHAAAAGFTIRNEKIPILLDRLKNIAQNHDPNIQNLKPTLHADMEVDLKDLKDLPPELKRFQPTGYGNPEPRFVSRNLRVVRFKSVGKENDHLRFSVSGDGYTINAIAFRQGHWADSMPRSVDLLYSLEENDYMGEVTLQLNVIDLQPSGLNLRSDT